MSILIKGMEMPSSCCQCPVNMYLCKRGYEYLLEHPTLYDERAEDCPLIPAADVRPVVLCRDCKHNMANIPDIQDGININENWNACQLTELYDSVKPDDFCSRGVKREES